MSMFPLLPPAKARCPICHKMGHLNALGEGRAENFAVVFAEDVCARCAELLFSFFVEITEQTRADNNYTQKEKIERFIYRMNNDGNLPPDDPKKIVNNLLTNMGIDMGEEL